MAQLCLVRAIDVISMKKALFSPRPSTAKSVLERRRRRVISLVESLPEASAVVAGETHLSLEVRGKRFGYFLDDHHGDGSSGSKLQDRSRCK